MNDREETKRIITTRLDESAEGVRLDIYLAKRFTYYSRTSWRTLVKTGAMKLNGNVTRPSRVLHAGEILSFEPSDDMRREPDVDASYSVIDENEYYIAVSKSGNLPVHPSGCYFANTLLSILKRDYGNLCAVNRLDRETSGVTLFAKTPSAAGALTKLFTERHVQKYYTCFVYGSFEAATLDAAGFLSSDPSSQVRKKRRFTYDIPSGCDAETCETLFTLENYNGKYSRLNCAPHTGRLHQIRATLLSLGFPLVGDKLYGLDDTMYLRQITGTLTDNDFERLVLPRQALHAKSLRFISPFDGSEVTLEAPLPEDMASLEQ